MSISFGSINTGLPKNIVQQLVEAEKIPLQKLEAKKGKFQEKKKLVDELIGLVEKMRADIGRVDTDKNLRELKVITNEEIIAVNIDKNIAAPGNYQFEVLDLAKKSSAMSSGFEDPDKSYVGVGFIQYNLPNGETKEIYVDSDHASLKGVAKLINQESNSGMNATVVNDGSESDAPWRLIISLDKTGDVNLADFPYFYFVDGVDDLYLEKEREAHDAFVKLDGFEIEVNENKVKDLIPGLTIDLKRASPGEEFSIQVVEDVQAITEKIDNIINSINAVIRFINTQNKLDENSDTSRTLGGDITLQTIESRLRTTIFSQIETTEGPKRLGDLGVLFQKDGTVALDKKVFEERVAKNFRLVSQILLGNFSPETGKSPGFIDRLKDLINGINRMPSGILPTKRAGLQSSMGQIDREMENKQRMITRKEENLKNKFARLEGTIAKIKTQGAGLASMAGGADPVTELG